MKKIKVTSAIHTMNDGPKRLMLGRERFPIIGRMLTRKQASELMLQCCGLLYNWDCIAKAKLVRDYFGTGCVVVGAVTLISKCGTSSYGNLFRPPFEIHAWWQNELGDSSAIIDIALPGLIHNGLTLRDEHGPFLVGRKKIILAGRPLKWMIYDAREILD